MNNHLPIDKKVSGPISMVFTGDIVLDVPRPEYWLSGIRPALLDADIAIGHLEVPHTGSSHELAGDVPAPGADPAHLSALKHAGVRALTLAGNHIADCGPEGINETIRELDNLGIAHCGAGQDLARAREPMILTAAGIKNIAVFSYNCIGPENGWATKERAGCAYLPVATFDGLPAAPASRFTLPGPDATQILKEDIGAIRDNVGIVVVALHKGTVHTPAVVEKYERSLARIAIEAGADAVISHHAHIVRGIEFIQGKPVFHGLGNGCVVTRALDPNQDHPARAAWARKRCEMFGFEPDPAYPLAPFHPEAVNAFLARLDCYSDGHIQAGIVPVFVDPPGRPRLADEQEMEMVCRYVENITAQAELGSVKLQRIGDRVVVA